MTRQSPAMAIRSYSCNRRILSEFADARSIIDLPRHRLSVALRPHGPYERDVVYVGKFDEATWRFFNAIGLSPTYLRNANRGMAAVDQQITYVRELYAGSIVSIYSRVTEVKPKRLVFIHEMMNDEIHEVAARTTLTGVHLDTVARKSCPFEEHILRTAQSLVAGSGPNLCLWKIASSP